MESVVAGDFYFSIFKEMRAKSHTLKQQLFLILFCITSLSMSLNGQNLKQHQWNQRVILIITNATENDNYKQQLEEFDVDSEAFKERKLITYTILPEHYQLHDKSTNDWIKSSELYKAYNPKKLAFKVILIGLDGSEKLEQSEVLTTQKLFSTIDAMPMRRSELRNKP